MCLYPKLIKNRKYVANKKNGGVIPPFLDERVLYVPIGCGKCLECMKKKASDWNVRLHEEIKHQNLKGYFVTLTFNEERLEYYSNRMGANPNDIASGAVRHFTENWRKEYKKSVRHWLITELGHNGTQRVHLHGIIWTDKGEDAIKKHWKNGFVYIGQYVNAKTINYISKYVTKVDTKHPDFKGKIFASKGIGSKYLDSHNSKLNKYEPDNTNECYHLPNGSKKALPIYYRNKLYDDETRETLWVEKIKKAKRFVLGQEIDISTSEGLKQYKGAVNAARRKNKRLKYGNPDDYKQEVYDLQMLKLNRLG